jgi:hypothetical protein
VSDVWAFIAAHWLGILLALLGLAALAWAARSPRRPVHRPRMGCTPPPPTPFRSLLEPPPGSDDEPPRAA